MIMTPDSWWTRIPNKMLKVPKTLNFAGSQYSTGAAWRFDVGSDFRNAGSAKRQIVRFNECPVLPPSSQDRKQAQAEPKQARYRQPPNFRMQAVRIGCQGDADAYDCAECPDDSSENRFYTVDVGG